MQDEKVVTVPKDYGLDLEPWYVGNATDKRIRSKFEDPEVQVGSFVIRVSKI